MAADSELEYLTVFIEEVTTSLIVDNYKDCRNLQDVASEKKCLIEPGQFLSSDGAFFKKRYKVKLSLESEENIMSIINEIINGTIKYNKRDGSLTEESVMCNIKFAYSNKSWVTQKGRWKNDIFIDVEWCTS